MTELPVTPKRLSASMKAMLITIPAIGILSSALILSLYLNPASSEAESESNAPTNMPTPLVLENSHVLDDAGSDAPTLVEFLDFECEACGAFYPYVEDIREEYKGELNYVVRYFPIPGHFNSMNAAVAVEAAAQQGQFEPMYKLMYETLPEWGEKKVTEAPRFRTYAEQIGLDMNAFDAAVADPATEQRVSQDFDAGVSLGVNSTPTFFLDGEALQLERIEDLTDAIDAAIADK